MTDGNTVSALASRSETVRDETSPAPALASVVARVTHAPVMWLALVVSASVVVRAAIAVNVPSPWILPDEVVYSEVAKSLAAGGFPAVRGVHELGWGVVYQALIAPAWVMVADPVRAYHAALVISALVMSLAAVPAYALARLFVSRCSSLLVSAATVLVPSMAYTGVLMTENAFYPAFLLAVLLIARAVQRPTAGRQTLALLGLVVVAFTRIQGLALVGAYLLAVGIYALTGPRADRAPYVKRFGLTAVALIATPLAPMIVSAARGEGIFGWLGSRSGTFAEFHAHEIPEWFAYLTSDLILYVAVVPAAATAIMLARGLSRGASERLRLFAAVALPTFAAMLGSVSLVSASLDVDQTENLNERYVFYVVPLLFVGLALWVREGLPRPRRWAVAVVIACCVLAIGLPIDRLEYNAGFQSVALLPWLSLSLSPASLALLVGAFVLGCGALWLSCRPERVGRLCLLVALWMLFLGVVTVGTNANSATNSAYAFEGLARTWVDDAVGSRPVPVLWDEEFARPDLPDPFSSWLMVTELFNGRVGDVYRLGRPTYYENFLPTVPVSRGADGTIVDARGRSIETRYVLVSCRTPVEGTVVAHAPRGALQLIRTKGRLRFSDSRPCIRRNP